MVNAGVVLSLRQENTNVITPSSSKRTQWLPDGFNHPGLPLSSLLQLLLGQHAVASTSQAPLESGCPCPTPLWTTRSHLENCDSVLTHFPSHKAPLQCILHSVARVFPCVCEMDRVTKAP